MLKDVEVISVVKGDGAAGVAGATKGIERVWITATQIREILAGLESDERDDGWDW